MRIKILKSLVEFLISNYFFEIAGKLSYEEEFF